MTALLAKPLVVGRRTLKNRIVVPPMADFGRTGRDGFVDGRDLAHYADLAHGGAGLVIVEACSVTDPPDSRPVIGLWADKFVPGLSRLASAARQDGAVVLVQLLNTGTSVLGVSHVDQISPADFARYHADYVNAALRCKTAGFDGVELHAAHGMYLNEVVETSSRADGYGGDLAGRMRLLVELVREVKRACGPGFIVSVRFGNPDLAELVAEARVLEDAGADLLDVSTGMRGYGPKPEDYPFDPKVYAASLVRRGARVLVVAVGDVFDGETAEAILAAGAADLVAAGRAHLADPAWAGKVLAGEKPEPCRRCRYCLWYRDGTLCPARRAAR